MRRIPCLGWGMRRRRQPGCPRKKGERHDGYFRECQIGNASRRANRIVAEIPWRHQKLLAGARATLDIGVHLLHELRYLAGPIDTSSGVTRICQADIDRHYGFGAL